VALATALLFEAQMPAIGDRVSHYEIVAKLGEGGMGEVFLAHDASLGRHVALKFLTKELQHDPVARERFVREARSAAGLGHPHICVVHETGEDEGHPFIVMEYVEGETLKQRLARGPVPLVEALDVAAQAADAMASAHALQIVHRDIKPANVMVTATGHVKVMDFGLAKRAPSPSADAATREETSTGLTGKSTTVGTLAYMSPEQLLGRPVDHRSDIFSFGILVYEMVTGAHPFQREAGTSTAAAIVGDEPMPAAQRAPGIPSELGTLVSQMLAKAPADRPQSMRAVHDRLKRIFLDTQPRPREAGVRRLLMAGRQLRRPRVAFPAVGVLLALVALGSWAAARRERLRWAKDVALPEIERMVVANDVWRNLTPAYALAVEAERYIPNDPRLAGLFEMCSLKMTITTDPPGARVFVKEYKAPDSEWADLGPTPLEKVRVPIGIFRWRFEKEGYEPVLAAASTWDTRSTARDVVVPYALSRVLDRHGTLPQGMVRVQGGDTDAGGLPDFFIDKYEVTNAQYKAFIRDGGYRRHEYWKHTFVKDGKELRWEEAAREFVDQTGLPGPAPWRAGDHPEGQGDYPVTGISWYEAAAYAEYVRKSLPTAAHWGLARGEGTPMIRVFQLGGMAVFVPFSNFSGKGPVPVGSLPGMTAYGAFDMAGNAREWCWNQTPKGRAVRGGAWDDNTYMFGNRSQAPPMDRSEKNGFRCARYPDAAAVPAAAFAPVTFPVPRDLYKEKPVPDAVFQVYKEQFLYDKADLGAQVESRTERPEWIHEVVSFDAAYGSERVRAHLFLPRNAAPPFQAVVYFPGSAVLNQQSSQDIEDYYEFRMFLSFLVKNGRAVVFPVYKGTFERRDSATPQAAAGSRAQSEYRVQLVKDVSRSIDYLETRSDIDSGRLAYYGMSWGGGLGPIITAVEPRFRTSVLLAGGVMEQGRPEVNGVNYVTRVTLPTLMLNGRYDRGLDTTIKPAYDLLGSRDKKLVLDETDHIPSANLFIRETLGWLDEHLGPVTR
jgi:dienelactone hydrolase